jgi:hypothetical protein
MKRVFWAALMVCLLIAPARAEKISDQPVEEYAQNSHVVVATLDELQEAIAVADNGDTIEISQMIKMSGGNISADKEITIACAENFEGYCMFNVVGTSVTGLSFKGGNVGQIFAVTDYQGQETIFRDCVFDGDNITVAIRVFGTATENSVRIIDSEFKNCYNNAISGRISTNIVIDHCYIHDTYAEDASAAVDSSGKVALNDCIVTGNSSFANAGVLCTGTLIVSGGQIRDNTIRSTEVGTAVDIFCSGMWSIIGEGTEGEGYYDVATGKKLSLPIHENDMIAKLVYLKDEDAKEYFSFLLEPDVGGDDGNNTPEPPQEPTQPPEGENPDNPDIGDQNTPQQPEQPPQDGNGDDPIDTPPQTPEQPEEPPKDDTTDNPLDTTPETPQPPQKPSNGDDSGNDNYTPYIPPTDYMPSQRPAKPTEDDKPLDQPDNPAPEKPQLACNGAVVDTSRTVVLLGYEDGLLHEGDSLTRAQLATIIYRLLDDESIAKYSNAELAFSDVAADAWYAPYVNAIQSAGIVNGVGGGRYDPNSTVTWAQIITILTRFVKSENCELKYIQYSGWALEAIQTAVALEWIEDNSTFNPNAIISRGELVDLINAVLERY